jgi:hypothetical protein
MKIAILDVLKKPNYLMVCIGTAILVFDFNYYLMSTLPGSRDEMCVMGVNLNAGNMIFSVVLSALMGIMIVGLVELFAKKAQQKKIAEASLSGLGLGVGLFTFFCPVCALPLLSISGLSIVAQAFNDFNWLFKVLSFALIIAGLFMLNRHLGVEGGACAVSPKRSR